MIKLVVYLGTDYYRKIIKFQLIKSSQKSKGVGLGEHYQDRLCFYMFWSSNECFLASKWKPFLNAFFNFHITLALAIFWHLEYFKFQITI